MNLICVSGLPRSGSTLLCQLLAQHPDVYSTGHSSPLVAVLENIRSTFSSSDFSLAQLDVDFDLAYGRIENVLKSVLAGWFAETKKATNIAGNTTATGTNATNIAGNTTAIGTNATNIAGNTTAIGTNSLAINGLDGQVSTNATNIDNNAIAVVDLDGRVTVNGENIVNNTTAIGTNTTNISANTANIGDVNAITNLAALAPSASRTIVAGINGNSNSIAANSLNIAQNTSNIAFNRGLIDSNSAAISFNSQAIGANAQAIGINTGAISTIREGNAAIAAIPDLYLSRDETWSIAGGLSAYDDGFGGVETGFGGGIQIRSKPSDNWSFGLAGGLTPNTQTIRVQARIGG